MPYRKRTLWGGVKPPAGSPLDWGDPINNGSLCCYLMNENAGLFVRDIASEIDLQINAATDFTWQAGKHGPAVGRGSASGWMVSSKTPAVTGGQVTCGGWINYTQTTGEWVISQGAVNTNWQLFLDSGNIYYRVANLLPLTFAAPPINTWQHVMAVQNGTTATIYINGMAKASGTVTALPGTAAVMRVGAFSSATASYNFHGKLSGIRAWRRALSPTEIQRLYNEPFAGVVSPARRIISGSAAGAVLEGTAQDTATATGALNTGVSLAGAAQDTATATGALNTGISLAGTAQDTATATGALSSGSSLAGAAQDTATATGALNTGISLAGAAQDAATATGALDGSAVVLQIDPRFIAHHRARHFAAPDISRRFRVTHRAREFRAAA